MLVPSVTENHLVCLNPAPVKLRPYDRIEMRTQFYYYYYYYYYYYHHHHHHQFIIIIIVRNHHL